MFGVIVMSVQGIKPKQASDVSVINSNPQLRAELARVMSAIREEARAAKYQWEKDVETILTQEGIGRRVARYAAKHSRSGERAYKKATDLTAAIDEMNKFQ